MEFVKCPGCDYVWDLDEVPWCLECNRCPRCGSKSHPQQQYCRCGFPKDPEDVETVKRDAHVPVSEVETEKRRYVVRKELETRKAIVHVIVHGTLGVILLSVLNKQGWTLLSFCIVVGLLMTGIWLTELAFGMVEEWKLSSAEPSDVDQ